MRSPSRAKLLAIEIAWLLGSWAFSYLLTGVLLGYFSSQGYRLFWSSPVDIQMHNTYFVLGIFEATLLLFLFIALLLTATRVLVGGFRRAATITLGGLLIFMLLVATLVGVAYARFPG
jgi:heme/copper-type cytochrome/quinol oxidase subunit 1